MSDGKLPYGKQWIFKKDIKAVSDVLSSDWITQGPKVEEFEGRLAKYCGAKYAVVVSSATAGLHLACLCAGLKKGSEGVTSPLTFLASSNSIIYCGAKPVFCDIDKDTKCIDVKLLEKKITNRTKVIIPVDFSGHPADLDQIKKIAKRKNIIVIEDAAHALGAKYKNKNIGSISDMTVFSFHPVKHITTGEGGAILTNSKYFYEKLKVLRTHGIIKDDKKFIFKSPGQWYYEMQELGFNYRLTDFQCALGIKQLEHLDFFVSKRRELADYYNYLLKDVKGIVLPKESKWAYSSYHLYTVSFENQSIRKKVFEGLYQSGINSQVHYIPVYLQPYYRNAFKYKEGLCPRAEEYYNTSLSLPIFAKMDKRDVKRVCERLKEIL